MSSRLLSHWQGGGSSSEASPGVRVGLANVPAPLGLNELRVLWLSNRERFPQGRVKAFHTDGGADGVLCTCGQRVRNSEAEQAVLRPLLYASPPIWATAVSEHFLMKRTHLGRRVPLPRLEWVSGPGWNSHSSLHGSRAQAHPPVYSLPGPAAQHFRPPATCLSPVWPLQPGRACSKPGFPRACHPDSQLVHLMFH